KELIRYVRTYPGSPQAIKAITVVTVGSAIAVAERRALWALVVEANKNKPRVLNQIAYDAIAADELDQALIAAKRQIELLKDDPIRLDTLAEVHHARGERAEALAQEDKALSLLPAGDPTRPLLDKNRARFAAE